MAEARPRTAARRRRIAVALAIATVGGCAAERRSGPLGPDAPCQEEVAATLGRHGLQTRDLARLSWSARRASPQRDSTIVGYQFRIVPRSCVAGELRIATDTDCRITAIETAGGCRVSGVAPAS